MWDEFHSELQQKSDVGRRRCAMDSVWTLIKDPSRLQLLRSAADQLPSAHLLITNIIIAIIIIIITITAIVSCVFMKYKYETLIVLSPSR